MEVWHVAVVGQGKESTGSLHALQRTAKVLHDEIPDRHGYAHTEALPDGLSQEHRNLSLALLHHAGHSCSSEELLMLLCNRKETDCYSRKPVRGSILVCSSQLLKHSRCAQKAQVRVDSITSRLGGGCTAPPAFTSLSQPEKDCRS